MTQNPDPSVARFFYGWRDTLFSFQSAIKGATSKVREKFARVSSDRDLATNCQIAGLEVAWQWSPHDSQNSHFASFFKP